MSSIEKLSELIARLPGIGPRQARRIVQFLLRSNQQFLDDLAREISSLRQTSAECSFCYRFFTPHTSEKLCGTCLSPNREQDKLMILEKDVDLENIERSDAYHGRYFVLGGVVSLLEKKGEQAVRDRELVETIKAHQKEYPLKEVVLALSATPAGEETVLHVTEVLEPLAKEFGFTISRLGKGISTGSELEYVDPDTIKNALERRS